MCVISRRKSADEKCRGSKRRSRGALPGEHEQRWGRAISGGHRAGTSRKVYRNRCKVKNQNARIKCESTHTLLYPHFDIPLIPSFPSHTPKLN